MKILINTISKYSDRQNEQFLKDIHQNYADFYPGDEMIWLVSEDRSPLWLHEITKNKVLIVKRNDIPLINNIRERKKILSWVSTLNPDTVLGLNPVFAASSYHQVFLPSCLTDIYKSPDSISSAQKKKLSKGFASCSAAIVHSKYERDFWSHHFPSSESKTRILYQSSTHLNTPLNYAEKISAKEKFTSVQDYFLAAPGPDKETTTLMLKGFSGFKRWQRSHMKLVLSARNTAEKNDLEALLTNYRFREDVIIADTESDDYDLIIASCYAAILPDKFDYDFRFAIRAISGAVLLIIPEESIYSEIIQPDQAFTFKYHDKDDITRVLLTSFREEQKRSATILKAGNLTGIYNRQSYFRQLHQILKKPEV